MQPDISTDGEVPWLGLGSGETGGSDAKVRAWCVCVCVSFCLGVSPPPCHRHMVAATIGPCSGNILLTFGGSCLCHLETKTNGLTSLSVGCTTSPVPDRAWFFLLAFSYILTDHIDALYGRKSIVATCSFWGGYNKNIMSQFLVIPPPP